MTKPGNGVGPMGSFPLNELALGLEVTGLGAPASPDVAFGMAPGPFTAQVRGILTRACLDNCMNLSTDDTCSQRDRNVIISYS